MEGISLSTLLGSDLLTGTVIGKDPQQFSMHLFCNGFVHMTILYVRDIVG